MVVNGVLSALSLAPSSRLTLYLSKIKRICCVLLHSTKRRAMKCSAKSFQVLIQSGLSNDWTSAMPSPIATLTTLLPMELVLDSALCFSRMCNNMLLQEQCIINCPSNCPRPIASLCKPSLGAQTETCPLSALNINHHPIPFPRLWFTLFHHCPEIYLTRVDSIFYKRAE